MACNGDIVNLCLCFYCNIETQTEIHSLVDIHPGPGRGKSGCLLKVLPPRTEALVKSKKWMEGQTMEVI